MFAVTKVIDKCISRATEKILPNRIKRLIFLSTFIAYIQGSDKPDKELACKINQLLSLAHRDNAILTPPILQKKIWSNIIPRDKVIGEAGIALRELTEVAGIEVYTAQARYISNRIIDNIPQSLRYGSNRRIRHDLMTLLINLPKLQHAA